MVAVWLSMAGYAALRLDRLHSSARELSLVSSKQREQLEGLWTIVGELREQRKASREQTEALCGGRGASARGKAAPGGGETVSRQAATSKWQMPTVWPPNPPAAPPAAPSRAPSQSSLLESLLMDGGGSGSYGARDLGRRKDPYDYHAYAKPGAEAISDLAVSRFDALENLGSQYDWPLSWGGPALGSKSPETASGDQGERLPRKRRKAPGVGSAGDFFADADLYNLGL
mmetsp:Transcript_121750/g.221459  ORF Transcript_121750/g.221459 Transcript_121750/m.221459 type:complete len:229 (+) Transcript_121750:2-688(+)